MRRQQQRHSKRLWFTSSASTALAVSEGTAYSGLYECEVTDVNADLRKFMKSGNNSEQQPSYCQNPRTLANGWERDGRYHFGVPLYNVQLHQVQADVASTDNNGDDTQNQHRQPEYVYARTYVKEHKSWEIVRARIPELLATDTKTSSAISADYNHMQFQSFFRSPLQFDYNECDFDCCDREQGNAYALITPKTFTIAKNGDVFIAWDGFYKDCTIDEDKGKLQWTIGISKLDTTNSACSLSGSNYDNKANFVECTDPIAIVYQTHESHSVTMPHGGLAVLEPQAAKDVQERTFLLSVLRHSDTKGEVHNDLWAFKEQTMLQTVATTPVDSLFLDEVVEDGGTMRLHRASNDSQSTTSKFQLCRSLFNKGIACSVIAWDEQTNNVSMASEPKDFLSTPQVESFCKLDESAHNQKHSSHLERLTTVATGFDVLWNDEYGFPERVFFGCWGTEGGNGNFGTVDGDGNLVQTLGGAYPGSVLLLPSHSSYHATSS
ncbi:MAG: hypothetical protein SGARI_001761, partial [Bacillariaceae sp.]